MSLLLIPNEIQVQIFDMAIISTSYWALSMTCKSVYRITSSRMYAVYRNNLALCDKRRSCEVFHGQQFIPADNIQIALDLFMELNAYFTAVSGPIMFTKINTLPMNDLYHNTLTYIDQYIIHVPGGYCTWERFFDSRTSNEGWRIAEFDNYTSWTDGEFIKFLSSLTESLFQQPGNIFSKMCVKRRGEYPWEQIKFGCNSWNYWTQFQRFVK